MKVLIKSFLATRVLTQSKRFRVRVKNVTYVALKRRYSFCSHLFRKKSKASTSQLVNLKQPSDPPCPTHFVPLDLLPTHPLSNSPPFTPSNTVPIVRQASITYRIYNGQNIWASLMHWSAVLPRKVFS